MDDLASLLAFETRFGRNLLNTCKTRFITSNVRFVQFTSFMQQNLFGSLGRRTLLQRRPTTGFSRFSYLEFVSEERLTAPLLSPSYVVSVSSTFCELMLDLSCFSSWSLSRPQSSFSALFLSLLAKSIQCARLLFTRSSNGCRDDDSTANA